MNLASAKVTRCRALRLSNSVKRHDSANSFFDYSGTVSTGRHELSSRQRKRAAPVYRLRWPITILSAARALCMSLDTRLALFPVNAQLSRRRGSASRRIGRQTRPCGGFFQVLVHCSRENWQGPAPPASWLDAGLALHLAVL